MDLGGCQNKDGMGGRFFQCFQHGIERSRRKHVDFVNDIDFISALVGRKIYLIPQVTHIFDAGIGSRVYFNQV